MARFLTSGFGVFLVFLGVETLGIPGVSESSLYFLDVLLKLPKMN
jgi:hypothetical protein